MKLATGIKERVECHNLGVAERMQAAGVEINNPLQARCVAQDRQCLFKLVLVLHKQPACRAVVEHIGQLGGGAGVVYTYGTGAAPQCSELDVTPFGPGA